MDDSVLVDGNITAVSVIRWMGAFDLLDSTRRAVVGRLASKRWKDLTGEEPPSRRVPKSGPDAFGTHDQKVYPPDFAPEIEAIVRQELRSPTGPIGDAKAPLPKDVRAELRTKAADTSKFFWE